ncbi:DEAD/DEAH box helicase [Polyangium aurulentum]|uniref:DEAD/DEAH box helicase n=1 Tax=Polyangium aurulentum TaxID=2567896 RepID=UPI0010AE5F67|nr:DEAD/DEAH box helicase [Polyangium aurulentum]UQA57152.1 DEAD/DEAH box helicase [Polyangium aurulentum]
MSEHPEITPSTDATFASLGFSAPTLAAVEAQGFERPTPIQAQTIPLMLAGRDLVAQAQTGTGKTAAYGLPLVERVDAARAEVQALILCPTRELAVQVSEALYAFGRPRRIRVVPIYGGQPIDRQIRALRAGAQIVAGTPGRLLDHIRRQTLDLTHVRTVVLDEADEMLAMGFVEDIETILRELPAERQTALFSATMPAPIARLSQRYLRDPSRITIAAHARAVPRIRQSYYQVPWSQKTDALFRVLDMEAPGPTIIFCGTKRVTEEVAEHLRGRGCLAEGLHGDLSQRDRDRVLRRFREGRVELLVATDVAARGLDIETVTHVINYDIPTDVESYTHRIGRTGRAGREGDAITLVTPRELRQLQFIARATRAEIKAMRLPSDADIALRRRELLKQSLVDVIEAGGLEPYLGAAMDLMKTHDPAQIAAAALKLLGAREDADGAATPPEVSAGARPEGGMGRLMLTMGRDEGLRPGDLVGAIANETGLPGQAIGAIDILDHHAFVEVPEAKADDVMRALERTTLRGQRVRVEKAPLGAEGDGSPAGRRAAPRMRRGAGGERSGVGHAAAGARPSRRPRVSGKGE